MYAVPQKKRLYRHIYEFLSLATSEIFTITTSGVDENFC